MGNIAGHVIPSVSFAIWGLSWLTLSFWLYLTTKYGTRRATHSDAVLQQKSYIPVFCGCPRFPVEPVLKIFFAFGGVFMETFFSDNGRSGYYFEAWTLYNENGELIPTLAALQYTTIHSCFVVSGIIDIVAVYVRLPRQIPQIFMTMGFLSSSLIIYFHPNTGHLQLAHNLYAYSTIASIIFSGLRVLSASDLWINTGFSLSLVLQSTWLTQVGCMMLEPTHWDQNYDASQLQVFLITCFVWHVMIITVCALIYYIVLWMCARRMYGRERVSNNDDEKDQLLSFDEIALQPISRDNTNPSTTDTS